MLIKLGVDVNTLYSAKSALLMAKEKGLKDVALFLEEQGAREFFDKGKEEKLSQELVSECYQDDCELDRIKELIIKGADVNAKSKDGHFLLSIASYKGHKEVAEHLISRGADVNAKGELAEWTALMSASARGYKDVAQLLIEKGADVNARDVAEATALMWGSQNGFKEIVELLISKGADVNAKNKLGTTAMVMAKDDEMRKITIEAVKKRNEKAGENVVIQGFERE